MNDIQILTLVIAIVVPLTATLVNNSRVTDLRADLKGSMGEAKETMRAEMRAMEARLMLVLQRIEGKLDHVVEVQATHAERLDRLEGK